MKEKTDWSKVDTPKPLTLEALDEAYRRMMRERIEQEEAEDREVLRLLGREDSDSHHKEQGQR